MKKEVEWLSSRCVSAVLIELARRPLTPMQLRIKTGMTKNNYVNIILKRLESEDIVKCLNKKAKIGMIYCINPTSASKVENILLEKGVKQEVLSLPDLNWNAYGKLMCGHCRQLKMVFRKVNELRKEGRDIIVFNLKEKLPAMATSDVYRALNRLIELGMIIREDTIPKRFRITQEGMAMLEFEPGIILI